ncbi:MAG: leader peptide processing enzyme [Spirochaetota bacterium]
MNKKVNTFLFILAATIVNIAIMIILFFVAFTVISLVIPKQTSSAVVQIILMVIFFGSIVGSFFIYHNIIKFISKRIDMDKYFHPIFRRRNKPQ